MTYSFKQDLKNRINHAKKIQKMLEDSKVSHKDYHSVLCDYILSWETIEYSAYDGEQDLRRKGKDAKLMIHEAINVGKIQLKRQYGNM